MFPTLLQWVESLSAAATVAMVILEILVVACLLTGFFTRLASAVLGILIALGMRDFYAAGQWDAWNASVTLFVICLALLSLGGGRYSLDRGISRQILPQIG